MTASLLLWCRPSDKRQCRGWLANPTNNQDDTCHSCELAYVYGDYGCASF